MARRERSAFGLTRRFALVTGLMLVAMATIATAHAAACPNVVITAPSSVPHGANISLTVKNLPPDQLAVVYLDNEKEPEVDLVYTTADAQGVIEATRKVPAD